MVFPFDSEVPTHLNNITTGFTRLVNQKRKSLPIGYTSMDKDVCCGRGKRHWNHTGNVNFRKTIREYVLRYVEAPVKSDKTLVVISIVDKIRQSGGRFIKEDRVGRWFDIGDAEAREKVGHSLRDQVMSINRKKKNNKIVDKVQPLSSEPPPVPLLEQHPSASGLSDNGIEMKMGRPSSNKSFVLSSFSTRRPSFLVPSALESAKAQKLLFGGGTHKLDNDRRSSTRQLQISMDYIDDVFQDDELGDVLIEGENLAADIRLTFRDSLTQGTMAQI
jgi:hypothetical protein